MEHDAKLDRNWLNVDRKPEPPLSSCLQPDPEVVEEFFRDRPDKTIEIQKISDIPGHKGPFDPRQRGRGAQAARAETFEHYSDSLFPHEPAYDVDRDTANLQRNSVRARADFMDGEEHGRHEKIRAASKTGPATVSEVGDAFLAKMRKERSAELAALPIIARSHQKQEQAETLRTLVDSPFYPKDILGNDAKDEEKKKAPVGSYLSEKGEAIENWWQTSNWTGALADGLNGKPKVEQAPTREYVNSLRRASEYGFLEEGGRLAANFAGSVGTLGALPLVQGIARVANRAKGAEEGKAMAADRKLPDLARNIAGGSASTCRDGAVGSAFTLPIRIGLNTLTGGLAEPVEEVIEHAIEPVFSWASNAVVEGAESTVSAGVRKLGEKGGEKISGAIGDAPDKDTVRKAARKPVSHPIESSGPHEVAQRKLIADLNLLHLPRVDPGFAGSLVDELGKPQLTPKQHGDLRGAFSSDEEYQAVIAGPEQARLQLRGHLGGNLPEKPGLNTFVPGKSSPARKPQRKLGKTPVEEPSAFSKFTNFLGLTKEEKKEPEKKDWVPLEGSTDELDQYKLDDERRMTGVRHEHIVDEVGQVTAPLAPKKNVLSELRALDSPDWIENASDSKPRDFKK